MVDTFSESVGKYIRNSAEVSGYDMRCCFHLSKNDVFLNDIPLR